MIVSILVLKLPGLPTLKVFCALISVSSFLCLFLKKPLTQWGGCSHLCCDTDWDSSSNCCVIVLRSLPVAGTSGRNAPMFSSSQEHDASIEWYAISRPSQEIPEHSKLQHQTHFISFCLNQNIWQWQESMCH